MVSSGSGCSTWHASGSGVASTAGHFPGFSERKCQIADKQTNLWPHEEFREGIDAKLLNKDSQGKFNTYTNLYTFFATNLLTLWHLIDSAPRLCR